MTTKWIQITSGDGPEECCLAVRKVLSEIKKAAKESGLALNVLEMEPSDIKDNFKSILLSLEGEHVEVFITEWERAISSKEGERMIIPFSMSEGLVIAVGRGYDASFADVLLKKNNSGFWSGELRSRGLYIHCRAIPEPKTLSHGSYGMQTFFPAADANLETIVRVAFAGHRIQACKTGAVWQFKGSHPLRTAIPLGETTFQFAYELIGGTFPQQLSKPD